MASLILQYLDDHPVNALGKQYSRLRLVSIRQESRMMKYAHLAKGDKDLFWQLLSSNQSQVKKSLLEESTSLDKRSPAKGENALCEEKYSLNSFLHYRLENYPPFLKKLYQEVLAFRDDFLHSDQEAIISNRLASLLLKESIHYFFLSEQILSCPSFYTDYKKYMIWLKLNQIKADFFWGQLEQCPDAYIQQQLVDTYDVFFFLQAELLHKGLLNSKRKKAIRRQFAMEEQAIFFYEDLYCQTANPLWLQKILHVTENIKSSLLKIKQPYYLEKGLLKDLGRYLLAAVEKNEVSKQTKDSLLLIQQQVTLTKTYQAFYDLHQLKRQKYKDKTKPKLSRLRGIAREGLGILNFFDTEHYFFALFIGTKGEQWQAIPKTENLEKALQFLEETCSTPAGAMDANKQTMEQIQGISYSVYQKLLTPFFSEEIPSQLVIIPDGRLNYLPFETLCTQQRDSTDRSFSYLLQYSTIRYYPSLSLLLDYEQEADVLINQVDTYAATYSPSISEATNRQNWGALPGGEAEVCAIEALFPTRHMKKNPIDLRPEVTSSGKRSLLHLAMHAATQFEERAEPGLVFSNASENILFLHEIASVPNLYPVVVLSACETGLGEIIPGEGIRSIGQQFLQTGNRSTIQSLSKVADASSFRLMNRWYAALADRRVSDQALRQAKIQFLNQADPFYQHPYFWGGFITYGQAFRIQS